MKICYGICIHEDRHGECKKPREDGVCPELYENAKAYETAKAEHAELAAEAKWEQRNENNQ